jgi:hypothetical protein
MRKEPEFYLTAEASCGCGETVLLSAMVKVSVPSSHQYSLGEQVRMPASPRDVQLVHTLYWRDSTDRPAGFSEDSYRRGSDRFSIHSKEKSRELPNSTDPQRNLTLNYIVQVPPILFTQ